MPFATPAVTVDPPANVDARELAPSRRAERRDSRLRRLLGLTDAVAVLLALVLALTLPGRDGRAHQFLWGLVILPLAIFVFKLYGLYDRDVKRMSHSTVDDIPWLAHAVVAVTGLLWVLARITPLNRLDLTEILLFSGACAAFAVAGRFFARVSAAQWLEPDKALLVGGGPMASVLANKLAAHPEYRSKVVGILADSSDGGAIASNLPVLGHPDALAAVAASHRVTRVVVSPGSIEESELAELLRRCRALALKVSILPQLSDVLGPAVEVDDVEGVTVLGVNPPWLPRSSRALKRALDIVLAGTLLLLLSPVMALISLLIKLDSRGPVFFKQVRVGRGSQRFRVVKFRTMSPDAEARRAALLADSKDPNWLHLENDPRITRIGRFLRLSSLDELPQLWNVLRGEMSMVGPRPLIEAEDKRVEGWARGRLDLTPGITGYWQVLGRTRIPFEEMVKLDYLYVMNWSLWHDIRLILRTLPTVVGRRGAN